MNKRDDVTKYLTIFALAAPAAIIVWFVFHAVYTDLTLSEKAVGYVDPTTRMGIAFGYIAMIGGTLLCAVVALWAGVRLILTLARR